jgi:hypothetical protein
VAAVTGFGSMFAAQRELGVRIVVKCNRSPRFGGVAAFTFRAACALMLVLLLMTVGALG